MQKNFKSVVLQCALDDIALAFIVRSIPAMWVKRMEQVKRWKRFYLTGDFDVRGD